MRKTFAFFTNNGTKTRQISQNSQEKQAKITCLSQKLRQRGKKSAQNHPSKTKYPYFPIVRTKKSKKIKREEKSQKSSRTHAKHTETTQKLGNLHTDNSKNSVYVPAERKKQQKATKEQRKGPNKPFLLLFLLQKAGLKAIDACLGFQKLKNSNSRQAKKRKIDALFPPYVLKAVISSKITARMCGKKQKVLVRVVKNKKRKIKRRMKHPKKHRSHHKILKSSKNLHL